MLAFASLQEDYVVLIIIFTILILSNIELSKLEPPACVAVCVFKCVCITVNDYRFDSHQFTSSLIKTKAPEMTAINTIIYVSVCS